MKKDGYYSSGQFINKAHISKKTLRYYKSLNIITPSYIDEKGHCFYSEDDLAKLSEVLFLKYLGFSLNDIKQMTIYNNDASFINKSLAMQKYFVNEKIIQLKNISKALDSASDMLKSGNKIDYSNLIDMVNLKEMEEAIKKQYEDSTNIEARISLHNLYSNNPMPWFSFIYQNCQIKENIKVLELGCGDGSMWLTNYDYLPQNIEITLSDISFGMLKDIDEKLKKDKRFKFKVIDAMDINEEDESYDVVIANHVLFYLDDLNKALNNINRILKKDGLFVSSTYSKYHMKEITNLVKEFDERIELSKNKLYEIYGKENGYSILSKHFNDIVWLDYQDELLISDPNILVRYILSCHGNQNRYIVDKFKEFKNFVFKKCEHNFKVTKDAGIFICHK